MSSLLCRHYYPDKKELIRKIVHIGTGPVLPLAWWLEIPKEIAIPFASIITICLLINRQLRLLPSIEEVSRTSYGTIAYGFSITFLLFLLWDNHPDAVTLGILVMAFGDGLAGLIGKRFKSPSWEIFKQTKSIAGTLTMALTSAIIIMFIAFITQQTITFTDLLIITSLAVVLEQIGPWGIDNLTVPIGTSFTWLILFNN